MQDFLPIIIIITYTECKVLNRISYCCIGEHHITSAVTITEPKTTVFLDTWAVLTKAISQVVKRSFSMGGVLHPRL